MARDVQRALMGREIAVYILRSGILEGLEPGSGPPPGLSAVETAPRPTDEAAFGVDSDSLLALRGAAGKLLGAILVGKGRIMGADERKLITGFAQQLAGALEMRELRSELQTAARQRAASFGEFHGRGIRTLQICTPCGHCETNEAHGCSQCGGALDAPRPIPFRLQERYRFISLLGAGGMGMVLAAVDERLEREVAIKLIRPEQLADDRARIRFEQEARTVARIAHRNVVAVYDSGEIEDGTAFLVMERLRGCDLSTLLMNCGRGTPAEVADLVRQTSLALGAAHREGIIHRDIKPQNIFREDTGIRLSFKILDFGLAKSLRASDGLTLSGMVVGTPAYMSPEQVMGETLDERTDIYSLAAVIYEAMTGEQLISSREIGSIFLAVTSAIPEPPSSFAPELPSVADSLLLRALAKNREERPRSIGRWGEELAAILERVDGIVPGWKEQNLNGLTARPIEMDPSSES